MANNADDKKSMDVSKPGKVAADTSARPVIVTNRPMVQDPMMKQDTEVADMGLEEQNSVKDKLTVTGEKVIKPIDENIEADKSERGDVSAKEKPASDLKQEAKPDTTETKVETTGKTEKTESADATDSKAGRSADKATATDPKAKKEATEAAVVDAVVDQAGANKREAAAQEAEAAKQTYYEKLIEDKKYFVKTGQVARRRKNRIAITLLVLLLLAVGAYLAIDAKLINTGFTVPIHIIGNQ